MSEIERAKQNWSRGFAEGARSQSERVSRLEEALKGLERAATEVHGRGAVKGPQWHGLASALIRARSALRPQPGSR